MFDTFLMGNQLCRQMVPESQKFSPALLERQQQISISFNGIIMKMPKQLMTHGGAKVQHGGNSWKSPIESLTLWRVSILKQLSFRYNLVHLHLKQGINDQIPAIIHKRLANNWESSLGSFYGWDMAVKYGDEFHS